MKKLKILLIQLLFIFLLIGCDETSNDNTSEDINNVSLSKQQSKLAQNIDKSISETEATYKKISDFRDALFDDGIYQGKTIICSVDRIMKLKNSRNKFSDIFKAFINKQSFIAYKPDYSLVYVIDDNMFEKYIFKGGVISDKMCYIHFIAYFDLSGTVQSEKTLTMSSQNTRDSMCLISKSEYIHIPNSSEYTNSNLEFVSNINIIVKNNYEKKPTTSWKAHLKENLCEDYYSKPIPNSPEAIKIEITNFSKMIAISLKRLIMHKNRLPTLESQTSTILSFESTLKKMKKDLAFDMIDPLNTEAKLKKYDTFFNKSLRSLQEFKKELSVDIEVSPTEIFEIKKILSRDYNEAK